MSTRDIEDALEEATGDRLLSRTAVSQVTDTLWDTCTGRRTVQCEYEAFAERDLSGFAVEYVFFDAVYESLRERAGAKEGVLCAWARRRRVLMGVRSRLRRAPGPGQQRRNAYVEWLAFLRDMVRRGLRTPVQITTDGAPGLIKAVEEVFPKSLRQRCLAHKTRNVITKVPARRA